MRGFEVGFVLVGDYGCFIGYGWLGRKVIIFLCHDLYAGRRNSKCLV